MALLIPAEYAQVTHRLTLAGDAEPMAVTYGVGPAIDISDAAVTQMAGDLHALFNTHWGPRISGAYTLAQTEVRYSRSNAEGDQFVAVASNPLVTTQANAALPQNCATLIHKRSGQQGRRFRGRLYLPGVPNTEVSKTGGIASAWLTTLQSTATNWFAAIGTQVPGTDNGMVILHAPFNQIGPALPPTPVTSLVVDGVIATQRRRLRK